MGGDLGAVLFQTRTRDTSRWQRWSITLYGILAIPSVLGITPIVSYMANQVGHGRGLVATISRVSFGVVQVENILEQMYECAVDLRKLFENRA